MQILETCVNTPIRQLIVLAGAAYLLNFFWESWHAFSLYAGHGMDLLSVREYVFLMGYVSLIDMTLIVLALFGGMLLWRNMWWFQYMNKAKWSYFIGLLVVIAIVIEIKAVFIFEQWSYSELMPTIFGLGLSPLLQLAITGSIALIAAQQMRR